MREWELIGQLQRSGTIPADTVSIGDDCCVWNPDDRTALSVDSVVEGRHFDRETPDALVGRKAAAAALSDLAAMGAQPVGAVVALACPPHRDAAALCWPYEQSLSATIVCSWGEIRLPRSAGHKCDRVG